MAFRRFFLLAQAFAVVAVGAFSQDIVKLDPALDHIVGPDAKLERVATGFDKWTEGPVWTREGSLLFARSRRTTSSSGVPAKAQASSCTPAGTKARSRIGARARLERYDP